MAKFTNELTLDVKPFLDALKKAVAAAGGDISKLESELGNLDAELTVQADISQAQKALDKVAADARGISDAKIDVEADTGKAVNALKDLESQAKESAGSIAGAFKDGLSGIGDTLSGGLLGGIVGGGIAGAAQAGIGALVDGFSSAVTAGRELISAQGDLQAATGATGEEFERLKGAAEAAFLGGVGESVAEATRVIIQAENILGNTFNPEQLGAYTAQAQALANVYDKDVNEVLRLSAPLIQQFGLSGDEAFALVADGLANAGSAQDDYLDSIAEYSQLAQEAGLSAQEFNEILVRGGQEGVFNTDKIADSLKELQIRLNAGDTRKAVEEIAGLPAQLANEVQEIVTLGEQGVISAGEVAQRSAAAIESAFDAGEISNATRSQLQVAFAGTPAEDLGAELYGRIFGAPIDEEAVAARAQAAGEAATNAIGQYLSFDAIGRQFSLAFENISASVVSGLSEAFTFLQTTVGPLISDLVETLGGAFERIGTIVKPILAAIGGTIILNIVTTLQTTITIVDVVATTFSNAFDAIVAAIRPVLDSLGLFGDETEEGVDFAQLFTDAISAMGVIIKDVGEILSEIFAVAIEVVTLALSAVGAVIGGVINGFKSLFTTVDDGNETTEDGASAFESFRQILTNVKGTIAGIVDAFRQLKVGIQEAIQLLTEGSVVKALQRLLGIGDELGEAYDRGWNRVTKGAEDAEGAVGDVENAADSAADAAENLNVQLQGGGGGGASAFEVALKAYKEIEARTKSILADEVKRVQLSQDLTDEEKKRQSQQLTNEANSALRKAAQDLFKASTDEFGLFLESTIAKAGSSAENQLRDIFRGLANTVGVPLAIDPAETEKNFRRGIEEFTGRLAQPIEIPVDIEEGSSSIVENVLAGIALSAAENINSILGIGKKEADTQFDEQQKALEISLKRREITYQEYQDRLSELEREGTDERTALGEAAAVAFGVIQEQATATATEAYERLKLASSSAFTLATEGASLSAEQTQELGANTLTTGEKFELLGEAAGATFANMVASGANAGEALLSTLKDTLKLAAQAFLPTIFANFLSFLPPPFNIAAATAAVGLVNGLIDQFLAFEEGGLVPGGEQLIRVNEAGQEFVMNAKATKKYGPMLEAMNAGKDPAMVGSDIINTLDNRLQRVEQAIIGLGQDISRRTRVEGELAFAGGSRGLVGYFDTETTYNKRRKLR